MSGWSETRVDGVATLTLVNPPRNFLNFDLLVELDRHLERIGTDVSIRVVVLASGVPGYFVAHADLDDITSLRDSAPPEARYWYKALRRTETIPQPVVAAIDGQAWGGGLELALACTLRWGSPSCHLAIPEIRLGLMPGAGGIARLTHLIGSARTATLALTGDTLTASTAADIGLLELLDGSDDFSALVQKRAAALARRDRQALAAVKSSLLDSQQLKRDEAIKADAHRFTDLVAQPAAVALVEATSARYRQSPPDHPVQID